MPDSRPYVEFRATGVPGLVVVAVDGVIIGTLRLEAGHA